LCPESHRPGGPLIAFDAPDPGKEILMIQIGNHAAKAALLCIALVIQGTPVKDGEKSKDKDKDKDKVTLHGAISDSQCAFNVHSDARSHDWMVKKSVGGAHDDRSCTLHCARDLGGQYVLVLRDKDDVYRLDDQVQSEAFAGKKVKATGTVDGKTHTLHVLKIEEER
jgi:hypothetical protein